MHPQAYQATSHALHKRLRVLSDLRIAQQAWDHQLEALHATPADSTECRQRLAKLEAAGQALTLSAKALQVTVCEMGVSMGSATPKLPNGVCD